MASAAVVTRAMLARDVPRVAEIERESFSVPWSPATFRNVLRNPSAHGLVARREREIAGYAVFWLTGDDAELGDLAVTPSLRRRGIGRLLVVEAMRDAARKGACRLFLEVRESNAAARALYEDLGFRRMGRRRRYYRAPVEDALVLAVNLAQEDGNPARGGDSSLTR